MFARTMFDIQLQCSFKESLTGNSNGRTRVKREETGAMFARDWFHTGIWFKIARLTFSFYMGPAAPFLECPGNFSGPQSYF